MSTIDWVLVGEGIECELEAERALAALGRRTQRVRVQDLLAGRAPALPTGGWVLLPGGFSFADHFGSGRLLAYQLSETGFFAQAEAQGTNLLGICNGFQVLTRSGVFGEGVSLEANSGGHFIDRWVALEGRGPLQGFTGRLPVRHGEGRLVRTRAAWDAGVEPFLVYRDETFDNGSVERVAGLIARRPKSLIVGLMPHPEVALRGADDPDTFAAQNSGPGPGLEFLRQILNSTSG